MSRATALALAAVLVLVATGLTTGFAADVNSGLHASPPSTPFRFVKSTLAEPEAERSAEPPIRLTASDGTGLSLVALEAKGLLQPPLAFTELHLTFENPRDAVIEGRFRIALPPGAALSRFAMKNDSGWQEREVVERRRAQQAYED